MYYSSPLVENLDEIPYPARHLLNMEKYFEVAEKHQQTRGDYVAHKRWTSIISSRGCPFCCSFCSIHLLSGRKYRYRSPENVLGELEQCYERFGIRHFLFEDDNLTLKRNRALEIFQLMAKQFSDITWSAPNGLRADTLDETMVYWMKLSGCTRIAVAPESGVDRVRYDIIHKKMTLESVEKAIWLCRQFNIVVDGSFVIGFPGETKKEMWQTIRYAEKLKKMGMDKAGIHLATPLPGSDLYQECKEKGYLREGEMRTNVPLIDTPEWKGKEVRKIQRMGNWMVNYGWKEKARALMRVVRG